MDSCIANRTSVGLRPRHLASAPDWAAYLNPVDTSSHHPLENGSGICFLAAEVARASSDTVVPSTWNMPGAGRDSYASRLRSALVGLAGCVPANARPLILQGTVAHRKSRIRIPGSWFASPSPSDMRQLLIATMNVCHVNTSGVMTSPVQRIAKLVHARQTRLAILKLSWRG